MFRVVTPSNLLGLYTPCFFRTRMVELTELAIMQIIATGHSPLSSLSFLQSATICQNLRQWSFKVVNLVLFLKSKMSKLYFIAAEVHVLLFIFLCLPFSVSFLLLFCCSLYGSIFCEVFFQRDPVSHSTEAISFVPFSNTQHTSSQHLCMLFRSRCS